MNTSDTAARTPAWPAATSLPGLQARRWTLGPAAWLWAACEAAAGATQAQLREGRQATSAGEVPLHVVLTSLSQRQKKTHTSVQLTHGLSLATSARAKIPSQKATVLPAEADFMLLVQQGAVICRWGSDAETEWRVKLRGSI